MWKVSNLGNIETGAVTTTEAGPSGSYTVPSLAPGSYSVRVTFAGFSSYTRTGITLAAGSHTQIDMTMQLGAVSQGVTVTADAPLLDSTNAAIGQNIGTVEVESLPHQNSTHWKSEDFHA